MGLAPVQKIHIIHRLLATQAIVTLVSYVKNNILLVRLPDIWRVVRQTAQQQKLRFIILVVVQ